MVSSKYTLLAIARNCLLPYTSQDDNQPIHPMKRESTEFKEGACVSNLNIIPCSLWFQRTGNHKLATHSTLGCQRKSPRRLSLNDQWTHSATCKGQKTVNFITKGSGHYVSILKSHCELHQKRQLRVNFEQLQNSLSMSSVRTQDIRSNTTFTENPTDQLLLTSHQ